MNGPSFGGRLVLGANLCWACCAHGQTIDRIDPPRQRVHDFVTIHGTGFGMTQGMGQVVFQGASGDFEAGKAYVWRDNMIRIRVPVGARIGSTNTPIDLTPVSVVVETAGGSSPGEAFQVISASGTLEFVELTDIDSDVDVSPTLGSPNMNLARTKDAEIGDVNGDGYPDLLDNNSSNVGNGTFSALHINNQDKTFRAQAWEPLSPGDTTPGGFAATIPAGVEHFGDGVSYDADFADVNGDGYDDLIHTSSMGGGTNRVRIFLNTPSNPGVFTEATSTWTPTAVFLPGQFPDDLDHADVNGDGWVDFLVTLRMRNDLLSNPADEVESSVTKVFFNDGSTFASFVEVAAPTDVSTHDAFFIDADRDGDEDLLLCNETPGADSQLFVNNGSADPYSGTPIDFSFASNVGATADFNADGWPDMVLAKGGVRIYLNQRTDPPSFDGGTDLTGAGTGQFYDVEVGDIDLDGDVDIVGATLANTSDNSVRIWLNDGNGGFSTFSFAGEPSGLPGLGDYQRLSADLLDLDLDGDLDLYVSGADGQRVGGGFGAVPNQLFENLIQAFDIVSPTQWQTAYGGSATMGRKVLVRIRSNTPILGLGLGTFTVVVDGATLPAGDVVVSSQIEDEYWLLVRMPAKPDGCYDLEVISSVMPTLRDTEPFSICFADDRSFDRVLAIDRTGSMNRDTVTGLSTGEKMAAARAAGELFVDLSESIDGIGVTSFQRVADDGDGNVEQHELARDDFDLRNAMAGGVNQLPAARAAVGGLAPDGPGFFHETSIGAGLVQAFDMLVALGDSDNERQIVLISDGRENLAPFWTDSGGDGPVMPMILGADPGVTAHTIAIGLDANIEVLQAIATATGGEFHNLLEGSGSFFLLSRLADTYKIIDEGIRDEQRFHYSEGIPNGLGTIQVPTGLESMSVTFHWNEDGGVKTVYLMDPTGVPYQHAPPAMTLQRNAKHQVHRIVRPTPGTWHYRTASSRGPDLEFFVAASGISELVMRKLPVDVDERAPGVHTVALRVILADHKALHQALVRAQITQPDKTKFLMRLYDDGEHGDGGNNDGLYAGVFETDDMGPFSARIVATGISSQNEPFMRIAQCGIVVPGLQRPEIPDTPRDPKGDDPNDPRDPRDPRRALELCKKQLARCLAELEAVRGEFDHRNIRYRQLELRARGLERIIEELRRQLKGPGAVRRPGLLQLDDPPRKVQGNIDRLKVDLEKKGG